MAMPMPISGSNSKVYSSSSSNFNPLLQTPSHLLDSLWLHPSNNPTFQVSGSKALVDFSTPAPEKDDTAAGAGAGELDEYDECFPYQQGKKRRLTSEQVQFLEKSFEVENKLEPERKFELAKELGLQPRQVAIWFQNRRARFKTKQIERDYGTLKANYDKLKAEYDTLLHHNDKLKQEVNSLKEKLKEEKSQEVVISSENEDDGSKAVNSAKSDVFDSDSPHNHTADSSNHHNHNHNHNQALIMEAEQYSDFSQDNEEVDKMNHSLMMPPPPPPCLPKLEEEEDHGDVTTTTTPCSFGFPDEEDQAFCFWPYI